MNNRPPKRRAMQFIFAALLIPVLLAFGACGGGDEGSAPVVTFLTTGVPRTDSVFLSEVKLYAAPTVPGSLYKISITNLTDDVDLLVYGTDNTYTSQAFCAVDNTALATPATSPEDCIITADGSTLYFAVDGSFLTVVNPAVYTIDVEPVPFTNLNPSIPFADLVSQTTANAYAVSATAGAAETISITGLTDDADLYIFGNDGSFSNQTFCTFDNTRFTGSTPEDCSLTSFGGTLFFIVDGIFSTAPNLAFTATASPAPVVPSPVSEGTSTAPIDVPLDIPTVGQVGQLGESFYRVNGLTTGTPYTVSITGLSGDADLLVFDNDIAFRNRAACLNTEFIGIQAEDCTLLVSGNTVYFSVTAHTLSGGVAFSILVKPGS